MKFVEEEFVPDLEFVLTVIQVYRDALDPLWKKEAVIARYCFRFHLKKISILFFINIKTMYSWLGYFHTII